MHPPTCHYHTAFSLFVLSAGDAAPVTIGSNSNLQDGVVITSGPTDLESFRSSTKIGNNVTIGHAASLTGVTLEDECLIGMGATLHKGVKVWPLGSSSLLQDSLPY